MEKYRIIRAIFFENPCFFLYKLIQLFFSSSFLNKIPNFLKTAVVIFTGTLLIVYKYNIICQKISHRHGQYDYLVDSKNYYKSINHKQNKTKQIT